MKKLLTMTFGVLFAITAHADPVGTTTKGSASSGYDWINGSGSTAGTPAPSSAAGGGSGESAPGGGNHKGGSGHHKHSAGGGGQNPAQEAPAAVD